MGLKVYALVKEKQEANPKKKVIKTAYGIELAQTILVAIGIHHDRTYSIEFIIDAKIPSNEMLLGMPTLKALGYRITIAGKETRERPASKRLVHLSSKQNVECANARLPRDKINDDSEDERISFLDEEEAKRIREWDY